MRAGARYTERHGNACKAAVTYFSVLSLVPVTMVAFAAAGFAMGSRPDLVERLKNEITAAWPGALGDTLNSVVNQAISSAATVGFFDLLALLGLGLALAVTFALTGLLSGFAGTVLAFLGLAQQAWAEALLTLLGVLIGLAANWLIFTWVIARLPRERVPLRSAAKVFCSEASPLAGFEPALPPPETGRSRDRHGVLGRPTWAFCSRSVSPGAARVLWFAPRAIPRWRSPAEQLAVSWGSR